MRQERKTVGNARVPNTKRKGEDDLDELVTALGEATSAAKAAGEIVGTTRPQVTAMLNDRDKDSHTVDTATMRVKVSLTHPNVPTMLDEEKLRKALGAVKWRKVTVSVLDVRLLDAMVANGTIPASLVARCSYDGEPAKQTTRVDVKPLPKESK